MLVADEQRDKDRRVSDGEIATLVRVDPRNELRDAKDTTVADQHGTVPAGSAPQDNGR
jgi:hypothetical protein